MSEIIGKMTKKLRKSIFDEAMDRGYKLYTDGFITIEQWNKYSWTCYEFQDENITANELEERLNDI